MHLKLAILSLFLLFIPFAYGQKSGAEKVVVDGEANSGNKDEWANMELIPRDQLCLLCHSVITKFQQASNTNPEQFKNVSSWRL